MRIAALIAASLMISGAARAGGPMEPCEECEAAEKAVAKLGPAQLAAALLATEADGDPDYHLRRAALDRIVAIPVAQAVPALLAQFRSAKCREPAGWVNGTDLPAEQNAQLSRALDCERETSAALAAVLCREPSRRLDAVLPAVVKAFDARWFDWLDLGRECLDSEALLTALAPKALAIAGKAATPANHLEALVPFGARARSAMPWIAAALKVPEQQVAALHLAAAIGRGAAETLPAVLELLDAKDTHVAEAAATALAHVGTPEQLADALDPRLASGCKRPLHVGLRLWQQSLQSDEGVKRFVARAGDICRRCPEWAATVAEVLRDTPGGVSQVPVLLEVLRNPELGVQLELAQALHGDWQHPADPAHPWGRLERRRLTLDAADEKLVQRIFTKAYGSTPPTLQQVIRYAPDARPPTEFELVEVNFCRQEAGLGPFDGGWPRSGVAPGDEGAWSAQHCLTRSWCGPERARYEQTRRKCCASFRGQAPAWCTTAQ